jgi:hypothetical protein
MVIRVSPLRTLLLLGALAALCTSAAFPQGKSKRHRVSSERAIEVTWEVLVAHGYEVVRIEREGDVRVVYYRRGNRGRGKGQGPIERMVIREVDNHVVFEATPEGILVDIEVKLQLPIQARLRLP